MKDLFATLIIKLLFGLFVGVIVAIPVFGLIGISGGVSADTTPVQLILFTGWPFLIFAYFVLKAFLHLKEDGLPTLKEVKSIRFCNMQTHLALFTKLNEW